MTIIKPCAQPGCPGNATTGARCDSCNSKREQRRGTRQARGYDAVYDAEHRAYQARMDQGEKFVCWRCKDAGRPHYVDPRPGRWHLGHDDHDRSIIRGPECPRGNLAQQFKRRRRRR